MKTWLRKSRLTLFMRFALRGLREMATALVLVIGAALQIRTSIKLQAVNLGFATHNLISMAMSVSGDRFHKTAPVGPG